MHGVPSRQLYEKGSAERKEIVSFFRFLRWRERPSRERKEWVMYLRNSQDEVLSAIRAILSITDKERLEDHRRRNGHT